MPASASSACNPSRYAWFGNGSAPPAAVPPADTVDAGLSSNASAGFRISVARRGFVLAPLLPKLSAPRCSDAMMRGDGESSGLSFSGRLNAPTAVAGSSTFNERIPCQLAAPSGRPCANCPPPRLSAWRTDTHGRRPGPCVASGQRNSISASRWRKATTNSLSRCCGTPKSAASRTVYVGQYPAARIASWITSITGDAPCLRANRPRTFSISRTSALDSWPMRISSRKAVPSLRPMPSPFPARENGWHGMPPPTSTALS